MKRHRAGLVRSAVIVAFLGGVAVVLLDAAAGSARAQAPPRNIVAPRISGSAIEGRRLSASTGSWSGTTPLTFRYQWLRCNVNGADCANISGATSRTYVLRSTDVGRRIRVRVTASNAEGSASATSSPTALVIAASAAGAPRNTSPPTISGTPQENQTLTANDGSWSGTPTITFTYQWRRCSPTGGDCSNIAGATAKSFVLRAADVGRTLRVTVRATNNLGSRSATSVPTAVIAKAGLPSGATISINDVSLPNRLIIDRVAFSPAILRSRQPITARFRVSDSQSHPVQGALVFLVGVPFGSTTTPPEQATGTDGFVTFVVNPGFRLRIVPRGSQVFFVRARKSGERLIGGVSTRRLVNLAIRG